MGEVDHSPPSSANVKNEGSYNAARSMRLYGVHKDKFTFIFPSWNTNFQTYAWTTAEPYKPE